MHRRRKQSIVIELTALLDVIMILIFMVMNENSKLIKEKQALLEEVRQENAAQAGEIGDLNAQLAEALELLGEGDREELLNRLLSAESRLESYQAMDDVVIVLTIGLENRAGNAVRCLTFGKADDLTVRELRSDEEFNSAVNQLKVFLSDQAKLISDSADSPTLYVVFSYDINKVYQRDFAAIEGVLRDVETKVNSANFRCRFNQAD